MTARTARRGFTLVELLVVLAILAVLGSLVMAGVMRTRTAQQNKTTRETVKKMESVFARQRTAVLDTARAGSVPPVVTALAGGDPDRAKTLWAYIKYRRAFPQSFAEATSPILLTDPVTNSPVALTELAAPQIFRSLPAAAGNASPEVQAAACAYIFLTSRAERGEVMSMEEGAGSLTTEVAVTVGNQPFKVTVFKDTFGHPITFLRDARDVELNAPPYANAKPGAANFLDPFDPLGRLTKPSAWTQNVPLTKLAHVAAFGIVPNVNQNPFVNENWTATFVSPGLDGRFRTVDDIIGYRVRQGN